MPNKAGRPSAKNSIAYIRDAVENIQGHPRFGEGKKAWDEDQYYRGYCERQLGIIGEAASHLTSQFDYEKTHPSVPWRQIKALRNVLVHMYWGSDPKILWEIVEKHMPDLKEKVDKWIDEKGKLLNDEPQSQSKPQKEGKLSRKIRELAQKEPDKTSDNKQGEP